MIPPHLLTVHSPGNIRFPLLTIQNLRILRPNKTHLRPNFTPGNIPIPAPLQTTHPVNLSEKSSKSPGTGSANTRVNRDGNNSMAPATSTETPSKHETKPRHKPSKFSPCLSPISSLAIIEKVKVVIPGIPTVQTKQVHAHVFQGLKIVAASCPGCGAA